MKQAEKFINTQESLFYLHIILRLYKSPEKMFSKNAEIHGVLLLTKKEEICATSHEF